MKKETIVISGVIFIFLIIFVIWLTNLNFNFQSLNQSDKLIQLFKENFSKTNSFFQDFEKNLINFKRMINSPLSSNTTSSKEEILTNEEIEKLKNKLYEYEKKTKSANQ
ncbi:MAG: hypothetical protein ACP5IX_02405 [Patescibacteria group bacterium]